jgi:exopolysaccharide biosynthesis polyprenyl glycosylphosphotransferase
MSLHRESLWTGPERRRQLALLLGDALIIILSTILAVLIRLVVFEGVPWREVQLWPLPSGAFSLLIAFLFALYIFDQYNLARDIAQRSNTAVLFLATFVGMALAAFISFFLRGLQLGRVVVLVQWPLAFIGLYLWRRAFHAWLLRFTRPKRVLLVVDNPVEQGIEAEISDRPLGDYEVIGTFTVATMRDKQDDGNWDLLDDRGRTLEQAVREEEVNVLVFSARAGFPPQYLEQAIDWKFDGIGVYDAANFYGAMTGRVPIETIDARWILTFLSQPYGSPVVRQMKRVLDVFLSSLGLLLSLPFWPLLMILIKLDSPGPAIFRQERLGMRQRPITIAKFRSMYHKYEEEGEAAYAQAEDPRVTRMGKWLRKTRLDELPQLWNVLKGELSMVGLRPIRKVNADRLAQMIPFYHLRFSMKPGLTGWPQIRYRYADDDISHLHKFEYELYHIQNASLAFDLYLIVKTLQMIVFGRGQ